MPRAEKMATHGVWTAAAAVSLTQPLFDIGLPHSGDTIITVGRFLALSPAMIVTLAHMLAGLKLFVGIYLFVTVIVAAWDAIVHGTSDDAMLDVGLLQAGASMKGEFESRLKSVIAEVKSSPKPVILFIDEAHTIIGAGGQADQWVPIKLHGDLGVVPSAFRIHHYVGFFGTFSLQQLRKLGELPIQFILQLGGECLLHSLVADVHGFCSFQ